MLTDIFEQIEKGGAKSTQERRHARHRRRRAAEAAARRGRPQPDEPVRVHRQQVRVPRGVVEPEHRVSEHRAERRGHRVARLHRQPSWKRRSRAARSSTTPSRELLPKIVKENKRIIFNGNGYSKEWEKEAGKRGLLNLKNTVDALPQLVSKDSVALFEKYKVLNEREVHARYEIMVETYNKTVNVEGQLTVLMANRYVLPAALEYMKQVAQSVAAVKAAGGKTVEGKKLLDKMAKLTDEFKKRTDKLEAALGAREQRLGGKAREALPRCGHSGDGRRCGRRATRSRARSRTNCGRWPRIARCCSSSSDFALQALGSRL